MRKSLQNQMDERVKLEFVKKFRKEVDFHHKVAFRFEKAYRLARKHPEKEESVNNEIISLVREHSKFLEHDPSVLFYGLFLSIMYCNARMFEFLKNLSMRIVRVKAE